MAISFTTIDTTTNNAGSSSSGTAVDLYIGPPPHVSKARLLKATATITGTVAAAGASDAITIKHPTTVGSSTYTVTLATGTVTNVASGQIVTLTVTDSTNKSYPLTSTQLAKLTIPALGAITCPVHVQMVWDDNAINQT